LFSFQIFFFTTSLILVSSIYTGRFHKLPSSINLPKRSILLVRGKIWEDNKEKKRMPDA